METVQGISDSSLTTNSIEEIGAIFNRDGFVVLPQFADRQSVARMLNVTLRDSLQQIGPIEYESDLRYPGAPQAKSDAGGETIRRLKQAHSRDMAFTDWVNSARLGAILRRILGPDVFCPLAHHNCIMTKAPEFSSDTGWHQDIRYWSFARPDLVSVWLALGDETVENGCLRVVPSSHRLAIKKEQLDSELFFRSDLPENQEILTRSIPVELQAGDVLLFHCRTLHAASRNFTNQTKYSVVFTFRAGDNPPLPGTRSSSEPEFLLH